MLLAIRDSHLRIIVIWDHKMNFGHFGAPIDGFQYYCPLVSIDGTHPYGKYKAKLLVAVSYDENNKAYPLCFAIVEKKMDNN